MKEAEVDRHVPVHDIQREINQLRLRSRKIECEPIQANLAFAFIVEVLNIVGRPEHGLAEADAIGRLPGIVRLPFDRFQFVRGGGDGQHLNPDIMA